MPELESGATVDAEWRARLAARLQALRLEHGLTQQDLALRAGLSQRQIQRIEAGTANPAIATLRRLAAAMGTELRDLLDPPPRGSE